jgi:hypothetical protein
MIACRCLAMTVAPGSRVEKGFTQDDIGYPFLDRKGSKAGRTQAGTGARRVTRGGSIAPYCWDVRPLSLCTRNFTIPTSRLQNINTKPATAAKTEAMGISASGPIYKRHPHLEELRQ